MINWASKRALAGASALALAALAIPALAQQGPESLLPPGFGDKPAPAPTPAPAAPNAAPAASPAQTAPAATPEPDQSLPDQALIPPEDQTTDQTADQQAANPYDLPEAARRSPDLVGVLTPANDGMPETAWGNSEGAFLSTLMREINAPVASRWAQILLRRALATRAPTPGGLAGADWVSERAWLLLRMGDADGARMLVSGVDVDQFTPRLFDVAMQTALANADPAALCPLVDKGSAIDKLISWDLARAMCAAFSGESGTATALIDAARHSGKVRGIDLLLAEKVVGAGVNGRRAVNIEWTGVDQLTAWRFGLANAVNVAIPPELFQTVGPHVQAWQERAPMLQPDQRLVPAAWSAALGILSNAAYVDLYGAVLDDADPNDIAGTPADKLRSAYTADDIGARLDSMKSLWSEPKSDVEKYARLVLTARAATRIEPSSDRAGDARDLIASMLTAGFDLAAERWAAVADAGKKGSDAWALLAVGASRPVVTISRGRASDYLNAKSDDEKMRGQFLVAALAGLGRLSVADANAIASENKLKLGVQDSWTRAIDHAAAKGEPGTVALLVAAGMQTRSWRAVPAAYLYHMVSALRRVGHDPEARMIAAEAITRA